VRGDRGFPLADQHCTLPSDMKDDRSDLAIPRKGEGGKWGGVSAHVPVSLPVWDQAQRTIGYGHSSHGCRCDRT
jgi:hypothetical protein